MSKGENERLMKKIKKNSFTFRDLRTEIKRIIKQDSLLTLMVRFVLNFISSWINKVFFLNYSIEMYYYTFKYVH